MDARLLVNGKLSVVPLHTEALVPLVIVGRGFTVTPTVCAIPGQDPAVEVGVTV